MTSGSHARFIAAYSKLIADVWSDPVLEARLMAGPTAFLRSYDIVVPDGCAVQIVRNASDCEPDLSAQIGAWEQSSDTNTLVLYVPEFDPLTEVDLAEHELDDVVAGISSTCACCCPCCCTA